MGTVINSINIAESRQASVTQKHKKKFILKLLNTTEMGTIHIN